MGYIYLTILFLTLYRPTSAKVRCGNHYRATCDFCEKAINSTAIGYNNDTEESSHNLENKGCNGECEKDDDGKCVKMYITCSKEVDSTFTKCDDCSLAPEDSDNCGSDDCTWHAHTTLCRNAWKEDGFNAALYLKYPGTDKLDDNNNEQWYFQRIEAVGTMPHGTAIKGKNEYGYISIQNVCDDCVESQYNFNATTSGLALFSIWDGGGCDYEHQEKVKMCNETTKAMLVMKGSDGVTCARFKGEGTGIKCAFNMGDFESGKPYYIVTHGKKVEPDRVEYSGYLYVPRLEKWIFLGRIQTGVRDDAKGLYLYSNIVEQFIPENASVPRAAKFYAPYESVDGEEFSQVRDVIYETTKDRNHERYSFEKKDGGIIVTTGGGEDVIQNNPNSVKENQFDEENNIPEMLTDFKQLFKCFNEIPYDPPLYTDTTESPDKKYPYNIEDKDAADAFGFVTCALELKPSSVDGGAPPGDGNGNPPAPSLIDVASIPWGNITPDGEPSSLFFNNSDSDDDDDSIEDRNDEDGGPGTSSVSKNDGEPEQQALGLMKYVTASKSSIQSSTGTSSSASVSALARSAVIIALVASAAPLLLNIG